MPTGYALRSQLETDPDDFIVDRVGCPVPDSEPAVQGRQSTGASGYRLFEIEDVQASVIERNEVFGRHSFSVSIRNLSDRTLEATVTVEFLDTRGLLVADHVEPNVVIEPHGRRVVRDVALIATGLSETVETVNAKVQLH